jgi:hypothetical protein
VICGVLLITFRTFTQKRTNKQKKTKTNEKQKRKRKTKKATQQGNEINARARF